MGNRHNNKSNDWSSNEGEKATMMMMVQAQFQYLATFQEKELQERKEKRQYCIEKEERDHKYCIEKEERDREERVMEKQKDREERIMNKEKEREDRKIEREERRQEHREQHAHNMEYLSLFVNQLSQPQYKKNRTNRHKTNVENIELENLKNVQEIENKKMEEKNTEEEDKDNVMEKRKNDSRMIIDSGDMNEQTTTNTNNKYDVSMDDNKNDDTNTTKKENTSSTITTNIITNNNDTEEMNISSMTTNTEEEKNATTTTSALSLNNESSNNSGNVNVDDNRTRRSRMPTGVRFPKESMANVGIEKTDAMNEKLMMEGYDVNEYLKEKLQNKSLIAKVRKIFIEELCKAKIQKVKNNNELNLIKQSLYGTSRMYFLKEDKNLMDEIFQNWKVKNILRSPGDPPLRDVESYPQSLPQLLMSFNARNNN